MIDSLDDFRKKYKGAFIFLTFNGKKELVQYAGDNDNDSCLVKSAKYGNIIVDNVTARTSLSYFFPESGLYNINNQAVSFYRVPARQWKRAPSSENCAISDILGYWTKRSNLGITTENLKQIYEASYPESLREALEKCKTSLAINSRFAISISHKKDPDLFLFWYNRAPVGIGSKSGSIITCKVPHLRQEIADFLKKKEPTWQMN